MMRQQAPALAYLVDPRRRDVSLLADTGSTVVQSALDHLSRFTVDGPGSEEHGKLWFALYLFHHDDPHTSPRPKWWTNDKVKADAGRMHPAYWWYLHGGDFPRLREVAIKVLAMWSIASPCERNWASHDFIHSKRRNKLLSDSLRKLVFIHWNMQLLRAQSGPRRGFVDVCEDMVEDPPEPQVGAASEEVYDDSITIPEEVETEIRSRRKEGGDRASARLLQGRDYEDEDEEDVIYEADDVWEGKDMIEEIAAAGKGKEVVRDDPLVSRVWDRWGGLDIVDDLDGYLHGSRHTLHMMKDIHECRRLDEVSAGVQQDRRVDTGFRATTFDGAADSSAATTEPCPAVEEQGSAPVSEELGNAPVIEERVTHATVLEEPHPVVEDQLTTPAAEDLEDATVISGQQTRLDGRARETEGVPTSLSSPARHDPSACMGTDDTTLAPFHSEVPITIREAVAGHHTGHPCVMETATHTGIVQQEGAVTDEGGHETDIEPPSTVEEVAPTSAEAYIREHGAAHSDNDDDDWRESWSWDDFRCTSAFAVPPLPTRVSSAIVDNTSTRGRKRKAPDTRGQEQPQRTAVQGRPRGRPPRGRSGRGRGRQGTVGATERLLGSLGAIGGGSPAPISMHGVRTRSRGAAERMRRVEIQEDDDDDEQGSGDGSESEYEAPSHSSDDDDDADTGGDDVDAQ
ncbi:hypothetical protein CBR_g46767 [Chara braunii]|uniref:HAT C-terminal dimerisation domain-containing protein n=1 Tax=Chara braunii TaxID=69332 RepID=A0A388K444_CHABU|nr:hypothetical protein CBR_g46767 [Chara braunii]|eukprot:GBG64811.1 hypothetical protein CBR_g46767 [Chara braunii]